MIKIVLEGNAKADIRDIIKEEVAEDYGYFEKEVATKEGKLITILYEKYFLRINSDLDVTIFYEEFKEGTKIELIASGGNVGNLIRTSYGAENKALEGITEKLVALGFVVKEQAE